LNPFFSSYPSLIEIADDIAKLLDTYQIDQVFCLGEGIGAEICALFALSYSYRCKGLCLIRPNGRFASINESLSYIADCLDRNKKNKIEDIMFAYIVQHRFGIKTTDKSKLLFSIFIFNYFKIQYNCKIFS